MDLNVGEIIKLKTPSLWQNEWEILRTGMDFRLNVWAVDIRL